jgi:hypothetical protein
MSFAQNVLKGQQNHFGFMDVILLHSGHQHVSATHVAIFGVAWTSSQTLHFNFEQFTVQAIPSLTNLVHTFMNHHSPFSAFSLAQCLRTYQNRFIYIHIFYYRIIVHHLFFLLTSFNRTTLNNF